MPKEEWGVKRVCPTTGKRFYDLNKDPIVSPYTGEVVEGSGLLNGAAFTIHSRIHMANPTVNAAAHSHSVHGKAFSSLGRTLAPLLEGSADRVVAVDLVTTVGVALCASYAVIHDASVFLDVAIVTALITFVGTVAFARYLEEKSRS